MDAFWSSPEWAAYETAYGDPVGTRAALVAGAEWRTYGVDLRRSDAELWHGMRKSYKSIVKARTREDGYVSVYGRDGADRIEIARDLHGRVAGRQTRSEETWQIMGQWLATGTALLALSQRGLQYSGFAYV